MAFHRTPMMRREAGVLYCSCFLPALTYLFPAVWLSDRFLEKLHCLSTLTILNKMGFHRNFPRSLMFAPRSMGGVGLCNLQSEMETQQILILLHHLRAATPLGHTIEILIRQYQLWAGICRPILEDTRPCPWIPDRWISHIHQTMHEFQIKIQYEAWTIPPLRQNDMFIMEVIEESGLSISQMEQINACRMYLNVTTMVEITDHTGLSLLPQALLQHPNHSPQGLHNISTSTLTWPCIHCPTKTSWKVWTTTICNLFTGAPSTLRLTNPLGAWTPDYQRYRRWHWRLALPGRMLHQSPTMPNPHAAIQV